MNAHFDVAAYALGVLDERDSDRFEEHLVACAACAAELDSMMPVVDLLSEVDADSVVATEQSRREGLVLQQMITTVGQERKQRRSKRLLSLAAAAILMVALTGGALVAGSRFFAPPAGNGGPIAQPSASSESDSVWAPLPPWNGAGFGNPNKGKPLKGEQFQATDPRTSVHADVVMEGTAWGTQLSFALSNITGPRTCQLVAVLTTGETKVLSTWNVPDRGYGTAANQQPLFLQAATALPRKAIAHVQVQAVEANGTTANLVTVPEG